MLRKRSIKGKSNPGIILQQPCRYYLKGTCTRSLCEYWHPPGCQFFQNESGFQAGDKCLFPHHKIDEQTNKKRKKSDHSPKKKRKRRQRCGGCASQDSELLDSQRGKQARGNPMQKVFSSTSFFPYFFTIYIAGFRDWHGKSSNRKKWEYECRVTVNPVARTSRN